MISADRFLVRSVDREAWLEARLHGVSATQVAHAATPSGFAEVIEQRRNPVDIEDNPYMAFGRESEPAIMRYAHTEHGILPNDWAIASADDPRMMATPDGLSVTHELIAEAKTTGTDWGDKIPIKYRRQVQWQLYVTGAEQCLFLWQMRVPEGDWFRFAWWEPKTVWIERDPKMIAELVGVADRLLNFKED
jgi:putative phage-type endonuclease